MIKNYAWYVSQSAHLQTSLAFLILTILIIIPCWMKTTTVERHYLPYDEIANLSEKYHSNFKICYESSIKNFEKNFESNLKNELESFKSEIDWLDISVEKSLSGTETEDAKINCDLEISVKAEIYENGKNLVDNDNYENIRFLNLNKILIEEPGSMKSISKDLNSFLVNKHKLFSSNDKINVNLHQTIIVTILTDTLTVNFTILNDLQNNIKNYLETIYNGLINFNIIVEALKFDIDKFDKINLETSFNYLESNILSPDSDKNTAHLAIIVGDQDDVDDETSTDNNRPLQYSIKNWGTLLFSKNFNQLTNLGQITNTMMIDFFNIDNNALTITSSSDIYGLHNRVILSNIQRNYENSVKNVKSLLAMLDEVKSIVIKKDVSEKIKLAVKLLSSTTESRLKTYQNFLNANKLIASANTDDSLLGLLYFPEDQKIGIYVPLFLPCGLSLLGSIKIIYNHYKDYRSAINGGDKVKVE